MTETHITPQPAVVPRPTYVRVRSLLAVACIAILALATATVLLATNRTDTTAGNTSTRAITHSVGSDAGARLDHRGRREAWLSSVLAEPGARLDHRGVTAASHR